MGEQLERVRVFVQNIVQGVNNVLGATNALKAMERQARRMTTYFKRLGRSTKAFKMEMLGVMFFGKMVADAMFGLIRPAAEAFGVFELWNEMLTVLFLPLMEMIFPYLLQFMEWFMNLPEPVKLAIGIVVLFLGVLGQILFLLGSLSLGFGSMGVAIFKTLGLAKLFGSVLGAIFSPLGAIIALIAIGIWLAWKENFGKIREWVEVIIEGVKNIFGGLWDMISAIFGMIYSLLTGDFEGFKRYFVQFFQGLWRLFIGIGQLVVGLLVTIGLGILKLLVNIYNFGKDLVKWVWDGIKSMASWLYNNFWNWLWNLIDDVWDGITGYFSRWFGGGSKNSNGKGGGSYNDMIWRPGSAPVAVSPDDNIVAFKGNNMPGGGAKAVINFAPVYNVEAGANKSEIERMLKEHDRRQVDEIRRLVRT